jgi:hypothetical protein
MSVRYTAAYLCTLLAIAAAQLIIPTNLALVLAGVSLLGLPLSLSIRQNGLTIGGRRISRVSYGRIITVVTLFATVIFVYYNVPELLSGSFLQLFIRIETVQAFVFLIEWFLVFAACRSLIILTDKDAVLSTVPSFAVLLLLIVVHKGTEVVWYFLAWSIVTAVLFALDHRSESRLAVSGSVPALIPGQDLTMSSRSLFSVVAFSVVCAFAISSFVTGRNPDERSTLETSVIELASRLMFSSPEGGDTSVNGGPERQIDFTAAPSLPTRTPLWAMRAFTLEDRPRIITPTYWRMFTLADYDGKAWAQTSGVGRAVASEPLSSENWPLLLPGGRLRRAALADPRAMQELMERRAQRNPGFEPNKRVQGKLDIFGNPRTLVHQLITSLGTNTGYLPNLPATRALMLPDVDTRSPGSNTIRVREDGAIDIRVLRRRNFVRVLSEVPAIPQYGTLVGEPPRKKNIGVNQAIRLSKVERDTYLQVPSTVTRRVRDYGKNVLAAAAPDDSNYVLAQRLATAVEFRGTYTLRPPANPEGRDAVDFFLFTSRRGYCTHFASALTILCRTQGIPARIVSGFANPEWRQDPINGWMEGIARDSNAHAWTEIWVDGWGWAVVDSTPSDDRGDNAPDFWDNTGDFARGIWDAVVGFTRNHARTMLIGCGLLFMAVVIFAAIGQDRPLSWKASWRLHRAAKQARRDQDLGRAEIIEAYRQASKTLASQYRQRASWETPREWLADAEVFLGLPEPEAWGKLTDLYVRARYSPQPLTSTEGEMARELLQTVSRHGVKKKKLA